jgi:hypothetical protein
MSKDLRSAGDRIRSRTGLKIGPAYGGPDSGDDDEYEEEEELEEEEPYPPSALNLIRVFEVRDTNADA